MRRILVLLSVALGACRGLPPIPDPSLTPCQRARVSRVLACAQEQESEGCKTARAAETAACTVEPPPPPPPPPEPTCETDPTLCPPPPPPDPTCETDPSLCPPPPPPPTPGSVVWNETSTNDVECRPEAPRHLAVVRAAQKRVPLVPGEGEARYHPRVCADLRAHELDCAWYGEELAVAAEEGFSENYDLILANGNAREAAYMSTCRPATRSAPLESPEEFSWPQEPKVIRAKVHVPSTQRGDGRAVIDAVALACGPFCPAPRQCCPACGPEGTEGRKECDRAFAVYWEGGEEHPSNPWLRFARPGVRVRACLYSQLCSDWVTAN